MSLTLSDVQHAATRIAPFIHRTPVLTSESLDAIAGCQLFFKCENFQKAGAFKMRGAANAILALTEAERAKGVATHSSGNHGQALARAAQLLGCPAHVIMPTSAPKIKQKAVAGYGASITRCAPTLRAREETLTELIARTGATFIHPSNDLQVIAGQGTAALELIDEVGALEVVLTPVGGGGLLAGTAVATRGLLPETLIVGGEPANADDAYRSLQAGRILPSIAPQTIADGLRTSLGDQNFPIIQRLVDRIVLVSEEEIVAAMRLIWERMKIVIEPSCAVPFAAVLKEKTAFAKQRVGIILTGGNVDLEDLPFG